MNLFEQVKKIKAADARKKIPASCYERSVTKALLLGAFDFSVFVAGLALIFATNSVLLKLAGAGLSGIAAAMMFVWAHDAAHGTLFKSGRVAELLGTVMMLPSLNMYRMWAYGHNKVHHGFTSFTPIDWIWRPLTPTQYRELSRFQRCLYRIERHYLSCAFHYLRRIWWAEMIGFNPGKDKKQRRYFLNSKLFVLAYALLASILAYQYAGGILGVLCVVVLPFIIFNYFIAMIVYLHHTHPDIPFLDSKKEWGFSVGALYCSTIIHCSKVWQMLLHNIMIHVPHHLDIRVPFYHLPQAYQALKAEYGKYIHEYDFNWSQVRNIFKQCKLYDFENKVWMTFKEGSKVAS